MVHHTIFPPSIIFAVEQWWSCLWSSLLWGRWCCHWIFSRCESFIEKTCSDTNWRNLTPDQEPGSCKLLLRKDTNNYWIKNLSHSRKEKPCFINSTIWFCYYNSIIKSLISTTSLDWLQSISPKGQTHLLLQLLLTLNPTKSQTHPLYNKL